MWERGGKKGGGLDGGGEDKAKNIIQRLIPRRRAVASQGWINHTLIGHERVDSLLFSIAR